MVPLRECDVSGRISTSVYQMAQDGTADASPLGASAMAYRLTPTSPGLVTMLGDESGSARRAHA